MRHKLKMALIYLVGFATAMAIAAADPSAIKVQGPDTIGNPVPVFNAGSAGLTSGPTYVNQSSSTAASANNISIPAVAAKFSYLSGFDITGDGATGSSIIQITVGNVSGGPLTYQLTIPAGVTTAITPLSIRFNPPLVGTAVNTSVTVNVPSFGAGNTNVAASCYGFQQ